MPKYAIEVRACPMTAEIEAENEAMAAEIATEMFHNSYDLDAVNVQIIIKEKTNEQESN